MSKTVLKTAPAGSPVTLTEVKTYLKWDDANGSEVVDSDARLGELILEATALAEKEIGGKLYSQSWYDYHDAFTTEFRLHYGPVSAITAITYTDTNGASQTVAGTVYELGDDHGVGIVRLKYNQSWPSARDYPDVVRIEYVCGYGTETSIPKVAKIAILEIVASLARRIPGDATAIPRVAKDLLSMITYRAN